MSEHIATHTEASLLELYRSLPGSAKHQDCPTSEHVAGYYIDNRGSLARAITYLQAILSGQFLDLVAFPGDREVLDILKSAQAS